MKNETWEFVASFYGLTSLVSVVWTSSCIQYLGGNVYTSLASVLC